MIAAFGNFDVSLVLGSGDDARREIVVQERGQLCREDSQVALNGFNDALDFAGADDGIDFRHLLKDLIAKTLDKTAGDDQFFGGAEFLVLGHFQDGVDGFLLRGFDKAASVDDQDFGIVGARGQLIALAREKAHHHLAVDEVLGASE